MLPLVQEGTAATGGGAVGWNELVGGYKDGLRLGFTPRIVGGAHFNRKAWIRANIMCLCFGELWDLDRFAWIFCNLR